jgi:hypothetical protein
LFSFLNLKEDADKREREKSLWKKEKK